MLRIFAIMFFGDFDIRMLKETYLKKFYLFQTDKIVLLVNAVDEQ